MRIAAAALVLSLIAVGVAAFAAIRTFENDNPGAMTPVVEGTDWATLSYDSRHDICYEVSSTQSPSGRSSFNLIKYRHCMECGPDKLEEYTNMGGTEWRCRE